MEGDYCGPEAGLVGRRAVQGVMTQRGKNAGEPEGEKKQMKKEKAAKPSGGGSGEQGRVTENYLEKRYRKSSNHSWWNLSGRKQMGREDSRIPSPISYPRTSRHPSSPTKPPPSPLGGLTRKNPESELVEEFSDQVGHLRLGPVVPCPGLFTLSDPLHKTAPSTANSPPPTSPEVLAETTISYSLNCY